MNKVITINLNGNAFQLEEGGFDALRAYLDSAGRRLEGNPDRDEIVADIEQAIADKFRGLLGAAKTVVAEKEVAAVIAEMGPVEDASKPEGGGAQVPPRDAAASAPPSGAPRRLYKVHEGAMIGGVCSGIAAYFNIDVTIVRILFAFLAFAWGSGVLLYILMVIILPAATTSAERAAAHGETSATAQEFIRRAREGYYEGMRTFGDKRAHREWRRRFRKEMKGWRRDWQQHWGPGPYPAGPWIGGPFVGLTHTLLKILLIWCLFTLATSHTVFGFWLPAGMPFWVGILIVIAVYNAVAWPLRAMRYSRGYGPGCWGPFGFLWCVIKWILIIWFIMWLLNGHVAGLGEFVQHLPPKLHHAAQSVRDWWDQQ
jgi:phage shock protein PspC (stress-responsive transcriptional regulator)